MNRACPSPSRFASRAASSLALALILAVAACGGSKDNDSAPAPELPAALGTELAAATAEVSDSLAGGDTAAARVEAQELLDTIEAAIDAGDVPRALANELRSAAERLLGLIPEEEAPEPPAKDKDEKDKGEAKGHDKKDKGDEQGDEGESAGSTTDTTPTTDTTVTVP